jgi:P27 family predicted phage terminase small subunit
MGKRGPRPTPATILKLRGSRKAIGRPDEPEPEHGEPPMDGLIFSKKNELTKTEIWRRVCDDLAAMNLLFKSDGAIIARYVNLRYRYRLAEEHIEEHGEVVPVPGKKGQPKQWQRNKYSIIVHQLARELGRLEAELGLTPSSRSRIQIEPRPSTQPIVATRRRG